MSQLAQREKRVPKLKIWERLLLVEILFQTHSDFQEELRLRRHLHQPALHTACEGGIRQNTNLAHLSVSAGNFVLAAFNKMEIW